MHHGDGFATKESATRQARPNGPVSGNDVCLELELKSKGGKVQARSIVNAHETAAQLSKQWLAAPQAIYDNLEGALKEPARTTEKGRRKEGWEVGEKCKKPKRGAIAGPPRFNDCLPPTQLLSDRAGAGRRGRERRG